MKPLPRRRKLNIIIDPKMQEILVPIFVCVVLPVVIVWLALWNQRNETNKKAEVMLKAIESGAPIDSDFFRTGQQTKTIKERLLGRLTGASITSLLGIACLVGGILICNATSWSFEEGPLCLLPVAGGILLAIGIALFVVYFVGKKMLSKEIEAEEKALQTPQE